MRKSTSAWLLAGGLVAAAPAAAEPGVVAMLRGAGATVTPVAGAGGLEGWFVDRGGGDVYVLYTTQDGHTVLGTLYDPRGVEVAPVPAGPAQASPEATEVGAYSGPLAAPGPLPAPATPAAKPVDPLSGTPAASIPGTPPETPASDGAVWTALGTAHGARVGEAGPEVRMLADPVCPWSRLAVARVVDAALAGRLRAVVVPVGVVGAAGAERAIAIAAAPDPLRAWFDREAPAAPADGADGALAAGARRIAANNGIFAAAGSRVVPAIWVAGPSGTATRLADGSAGLDAWLAGVGP